jgi:hypothetical protein
MYLLTFIYSYLYIAIFQRINFLQSWRRAYPQKIHPFSDSVNAGTDLFKPLSDHPTNQNIPRAFVETQTSYFIASWVLLLVLLTISGNEVNILSLLPLAFDKVFDSIGSLLSVKEEIILKSKRKRLEICHLSLFKYVSVHTNPTARWGLEFFHFVECFLS